MVLAADLDAALVCVTELEAVALPLPVLVTVVMPLAPELVTVAVVTADALPVLDTTWLALAEPVLVKRDVEPPVGATATTLDRMMNCGV